MCKGITLCCLPCSMPCPPPPHQIFKIGHPTAHELQMRHRMNITTKATDVWLLLSSLCELKVLKMQFVGLVWSSNTFGITHSILVFVNSEGSILHSLGRKITIYSDPDCTVVDLISCLWCVMFWICLIVLVIVLINLLVLINKLNWVYCNMFAILWKVLPRQPFFLVAVVKIQK